MSGLTKVKTADSQTLVRAEMLSAAEVHGRQNAEDR